MRTASEDVRPFADRREAGQALGRLLSSYAGRDDVVVLALPRGGVPVGYEVARALGAPLDVFLVRKLGVPGHRELAMGALASGGVRVLDDQLIRYLGIPEEAVEAVIREEQQELARREAAYRDYPPLEVEGKVVLLADDGLATGSTMKAAVQAVRQRRPSRIIVAAPVGSNEACSELRRIADDVVCARVPARFAAVGQWFLDFSQTSDAEVLELLDASRRELRR
ncbi:MAG TPA: phosphoribosyltransferase [Vicinamibacterales bacterium]|nr:phosphoribosyltransferase [Vicinamibacterales bacterium]